MTDKKKAAAEAAARKLERQKVIWDMARKGSKIARRQVVIKGGKK